MNLINYSMDEIIKNMRKNRKGMFFIFIGCILIGGCIGVYFGLFYKQPIYQLDDTIVDVVDVESIDKDEKYYYNAINELKEKKISLNSYIQYLGQVDLSAQSVMKIEDYQEKVIQFDDIYNQVWNEWWKSSVLGYGTQNDMEQFLKDQIIILDSKIDAANQMVDEAQDHSFSRSFVTVTEDAALDSILSAKNEKKYWESKADIVINADEKQRNSDHTKMDQLLKKSFDELNQLVKEFNTVIEFLEDNEQYDIVYNKYLMKQYVAGIGIEEEVPLEKVMLNSKNNAIIYARSVAGLDSGKERFFAILTFFTLFGVVVSILWGGVFTTRKNRII